MNLRRLTAGMVGFVGLTLEIAYTRIVSFKLFYYYVYFVIGLALLGFGAAATVTALSDRFRKHDVIDSIRRLAPLVGLIGALGYLVVARLPTDVNLIWTGSTKQAIAQLFLVLFLSVCLTAVFFALGMLISLLIVVDAADVRRLYFWDLVGAALGCLLAVPLQSLVGPPTMVLAASVAFSLLGVVAAVRSGNGQKLAALAVAVVAVLAGVAVTQDVRKDEVKGADNGDRVGWGAVFRVDVADGLDKKLLIHDGILGSNVYRYDGTRDTTARFDVDARRIPWAALGRAPEQVLIIGAAGGNEVMAALTYGVGHVDAVELNPVTTKLVRGELADYSGHFTDDPRVNYVTGDGRTFLARSKKSYDLIWFVAPDSYAASNAATSGAFVLSESYLYTKEMVEESFDHLTAEGMIVAQFGDFAFAERPTRTARYLVTARAAIGDEVDDFADHISLSVEYGEYVIARLTSVVVSKSPLSPEAGDRITAVAEALPGGRVVHMPGGGGTQEGITAQIINLDQPAVDDLVAGYKFDISPVTDDRPFFWHFTSFGDALTHLSRSFEDYEIAIGERLLLMLLGISILLAGLLLSLPFLLSRKSAGAAKVHQRWRLLVYFAALGFGFMAIEVSMIQRFALLLGYPTLSLSVSLFTLLLATAVGARASGWIAADQRRRLALVVAAMWVVTVVYLLSARAITDTALAWAQPARISLVIAMLFPVGVLLGMFLPTGIDRARSMAGASEADEGRLVAWCWAVNGFFSVIGSTSTTMLSMTFGFNRTVLIGLVLYAIAGAALLVGRAAGVGSGSAASAPSAV